MSFFQRAEKHWESQCFPIWDDCSLIDCVWCFVRAAQAQCQQGWRENEGKCYFFSSEEKTWFEAQSYCLEQHGHLLSIRDIHEMVRMTAAHPFKGVWEMGGWCAPCRPDTLSLLTFIFLGGKKCFQLWLRTQVGSEIYWMGLNDYAAEDVWEWSDGSPYYEYLSYVPPPPPFPLLLQRRRWLLYLKKNIYT